MQTSRFPELLSLNTHTTGSPANAKNTQDMQLSPHSEEQRLPVSRGTKRLLKKEAVFQRSVRLSALIKWLSVMTSHNALIHHHKSSHCESVAPGTASAVLNACEVSAWR
ncbi:uncharacterized [Tachysurus ichikawai]